jgi:hypothetical protein
MTGINVKKGSVTRNSEFLAAQTQYITSNPQFESQLRGLYADVLGQVGNMIDSAEIASERKSDKRAARIHALAESRINGRLGAHMWFERVNTAKHHCVEYFTKPDEVAKPGKQARGVGSVGVETSLEGMEAARALKHAMETPIHIHGGEMVFIKAPSREVLKKHFDIMQNPPGRFHAIFFSDDWCIAIKSRGKLYWFNGDISGCDASHGTVMFESLLEICKDTPLVYEALERVVRQCKLGIRVRNPEKKGGKKSKESLYIAFPEPRLYSGVTITTAINNLACMWIIHAITARSLVCATPESLQAEMERRSASVGFFCTMEHCSIFEKIQFLKCSPVLDVTGVHWPLLNIGVLLRASGGCRGDLPGSKTLTLEQRAKIFQSALLQGMYPRSSFPFLRMLQKATEWSAETNEERTASRGAVAKAKRRLEKLNKYRFKEEGAVLHFSNEAILKRYGASESESFSFGELSCQFETSTASPLISRVLEADYGLKSQYVRNNPTIASADA